uniref:Transcription factor SBP2 n=1 Tax=Diospyros kaki TaxID=35925 RepID=A0A3Q8TAZ6_DIOKA|nr:transcription factor SBP2 [Diospyros kaki]
MDWGRKLSSWEFTELGSEDETHLASLVGSSSLGLHKNGGGFSVDLKLGGLGNMGDGSVDKLKGPRGSKISSSPSASLKRTRSIGGMQNVSCLVDGCTADLSNCREYHRRHRVCERHSKTPVVYVGGKEQRFCQQCSRFQSLGEFDEEKRSCRKRLDGHNRRRRKPQPEAFYVSSGSFWSGHQGARLLQFGCPKAYATSTAGASTAWPGIAKPHQHFHVPDQQNAVPSSQPCNYNVEKRFPFLLAHEPERSNQVVPEISSCQGLASNSASHESARGHLRTLSGGITLSFNSNCAHSLLSSHPTQTPGTYFSNSLHRDTIHTNLPASRRLHFDGLAQYSQRVEEEEEEEEEKPPVLVPQPSNTNIVCDQILSVSPDDLLEKGASQVLPFSWK